jgi:small-conductance mechanosensitive channel
MNWFFWTRAFLLLFTIGLYAFVKKKKLFADFKAILPHIFALLFLGLLLSVLTRDVLFTLIYSEKLILYLHAAIYIGILVLSVKVMAFFIFDYLVGKRQSIKYPRLIKDIMVIILYVIGILMIAKYYLNFEVTLVLASSAVVTVVIGFALQDLLGDLFTGIALNLEESLRIGDWVKAGEYEGRIEQFRWRSIKIRTVDNVLVLIPNQIAAKKEMLRFGHGAESFALRMHIGVSYDSSPDFVADTIREVLKEVPEVLKKPAPNVLVHEYEDFAIVYEIRFWITDYALKEPVKSEIRRKAWYAFKRGGIRIPFPIRDVYVSRMKETRDIDISAAEIIAILRQDEIFGAISEKQLSNIAEAVEVKRYGAGECLIRENESGRYFYHILEGEAEVVKGNRVISRIQAGGFVGEISLFTGEKTIADVRVTRESKVLRISSDKFRETVQLNVRMARKLSEVIARRKGEVREIEKEADLSKTSKIKKETENIFLRIKKYFSI